jgi:hypothetical protein
MAIAPMVPHELRLMNEYPICIRARFSPGLGAWVVLIISSKWRLGGFGKIFGNMSRGGRMYDI